MATKLHTTPKGEDEIRCRTHKLGIRKRSVLILLNSPQDFEYLLGKTVLGRDELLGEIHALIREGFIAAREDGALQPAANMHASGTELFLDDEIIISEAKFLLIDFCVDSFGTQSQAFVDEIRSCDSANDLGACLRSVAAATRKQCPDRLPALVRRVNEINETA